MADADIPTRAKVDSVWEVARYRPWLTVCIVALGVAAAVLEGIGLSFLMPIIELAQQGSGGEVSGEAATFARVYGLLGVPFTLEAVIVGVTVVMVARYTSSLLVAWFREVLRTRYERELKIRAFDSALDAETRYFDEQGSDEILNAIVTQATYAGRVIRRIVKFFEQILLSVMYLSVAFYLAPTLTLLAGLLLGGLTYLLRYVIEPAFSVGDRVADANERVQAVVQAGTQGIRDVKLFGMTDTLFDDFLAWIDQYTNATISLRRNQAIINNLYQFASAVTVFLLIYTALTFTTLRLSSLGVFLFAMFRLAPRVSNLNEEWYRIEGELPHLVRTQQFIDDLRASREPDGGSRVPSRPVDEVEFDDVSFSYTGARQTLHEISFTVERGEFAAFVGASGAGKSTIVSLLARLYEPDDGQITIDDIPLDQVDLDAWRSRIAVVRQNPFVFNDTLRYNVTLDGDSDEERFHHACRVASVTAFVDELPEGYDTVLGDDGVRLSGGQKQRVALARALYADADVLVLDEATSEVDSNIEQEVQSAIEGLDGYLVIAISHRLSTVTSADRIHTIEDGEITESGTHHELLEEKGKYAELYAAQTDTAASALGPPR